MMPAQPKAASAKAANTKDTRATDATPIPDKPVNGKQAGQPSPDLAAELAVLFPDIDIEVTDPDSGQPVMVTVKEYRFLDGLEAQAEARPLIEALADLMDTGEDQLPDAATIDMVIGNHAGIWLALIARATGLNKDWLARLTDREARRVSLAMWSANAVFFLSRAVALLKARQQTATLLGSLASSANSSVTALAPDTKTSQNA